MLPNLWNDIRSAARALSRNPGFATAAIVTIGLGVGVNTGIFTVLNGVLFRNVSAPDAQQLVSVYESVQGAAPRDSGPGLGLVSTKEYRTYRDRTKTLSGIVGYSDPTRTTLGGTSPQRIVGEIVTCNYFAVLRQPPAIGRGLRAPDCAAGADPVVVLSHDLWTSSFHSDPTILNRTVKLNGQLFTVVGIAAKGTYRGFWYDTGYYAPVSAQPLLLPNEPSYRDERHAWLFLFGRRREHVGIRQVGAELGLIAAQMDLQHPGRSTRLHVARATPLSVPFLRRGVLAFGTVVMTAFGLVLLIACSNVANLMLARGTVRGREIAVRLSLGASRARIIQQLLTESVLISTAGGALGSVFALWSFQALAAFWLPSLSPPGIPPLVIDASPDFRVLAFSLMLTVGTGIVFGLAPALRLSNPDLHGDIKSSSSASVGSRGAPLQGTLVGIQVALCMLLMIAASLLLRGLYAAQTVDPGFNYRNVVYASYRFAGKRESSEVGAFRRRLETRVQALPGVESVAFATREPLSSGRAYADIRLPGQAAQESRRADLNAVTPGYFSLLGIPILRGRTFTNAETANDAHVAIVTQRTARNYWPGKNPIGQMLLSSRGPTSHSVELRVVGVAKDAQVTQVGHIDGYYVYVPAGPDIPGVKLLARSRADAISVAGGIRTVVQALDPTATVRVSPLQANLDYWRVLSGSVTALAASLGLLALLLAAVGIYGMVSYFVSRRFREIGIRMALGAGSRAVLGATVKGTMRPVFVGALIGVLAAIAASRALSSVLFGVSPVDAIGLSSATLFVLFVALMAGALAARRATQVDPMTTLRHE